MADAADSKLDNYIITVILQKIKIKQEDKSMMSGTMSASMVINNILVAASEFIIPDRMEQLKLILFMNLCDYTFIKNEDSTSLIKSDDDTFEILHDWQNQLIIDGKTKSTIKQYGYEIKICFSMPEPE